MWLMMGSLNPYELQKKLEVHFSESLHPYKDKDPEGSGSIPVYIGGFFFALTYHSMLGRYMTLKISKRNRISIFHTP